MASLRAYYSLVKPGVLYGNAITAVAGYLFGLGVAVFDFGVFFALCVGTTLVIASACALNNFLDQDIDRKMERTKSRALVTGDVPGSHAVIISLITGVVGFVLLLFGTNMLVVGIGFIGFIDYVVLYGMLSKRLSVHGTLVGSISGATPILAGYVAATGAIDINAVLLFCIIFFWQMPEFYSISIYRRKEYAAAGVPVVSISRGITRAKLEIYWYTLAFTSASLLLGIIGSGGYVYLVSMLLLCTRWFQIAWQGLTAKDSSRWARRMFGFSLVVLLAFCGLISLNPWLP